MRLEFQRQKLLFGRRRQAGGQPPLTTACERRVGSAGDCEAGSWHR